jgi:anti-sigma regulatory factor (Ser/Thr protein kinase)
MVTSTRKFVADLLDSIRVDADATSRVALATHELLENTLRHSKDGYARLDVVLDETQNGWRIVVRLRNRADADRIDDVRRRVESLASAKDPMPVYLQLMLESAQREDGSGLGLARIRAEADMELSCDVDGEFVTIVATTDACREQTP